MGSSGYDLSSSRKVSSSQSYMRAKAIRPAPTWQWAPAPSLSGETHEGLSAGEVIKEFLRLPLEKDVALGFADQSRTGNGFRDAVAQIVLQGRGQIGPRS